MDIESPSKEVSEDLTRESLIAISNLVPDNVLDKDYVSSPNASAAAATNGEITEKYMSDLISISYSQSPDAKALPVVSLNQEG